MNEVTGTTMPLLKQELLRILADNANRTASPQVVATVSIARQLNISPKQARQLIRLLQATGTLISDIDAQNSLITLEGLRWLGQTTFPAIDTGLLTA